MHFSVVRLLLLCLVCLIALARVSLVSAQVTLPPPSGSTIDMGLIGPGSTSSAGNYTLSWSAGAVGSPLIGYWSILSEKLYESTNDSDYVLIGSPAVNNYEFANKAPGVYRYYLEREQVSCFFICSSIVAKYLSYIETVEVSAFEQGPLAADLSIVRGESSDTYTINWSPLYDDPKYILREGRVGYDSHGRSTIVDWKKLQTGGTQYIATERAGGRYFYQLAERRFILTPDALNVSFPVRSTIVPVDVITAPEIIAPNVSIDGSYTVSWREAGVLESITLMERFDSAGNWLVQPAIRFNMMTAMSEYDYQGQLSGDHLYRARTIFPQCQGAVAQVQAVLYEIIGSVNECNDSALVAQTTVTVERDIAFVHISNDQLNWIPNSDAPFAIIEQQQSNGNWLQIGTSLTSKYSVAGQSYGTNYRIKSCASYGASNAGEECGNYSYYTYALTVAQDPAPPVAKPTGLDYGDDLFGTTMGEFRVNEFGAATYSIPIMVGAGTGGVSPDITLNYSSQSGNGIVGRGWSLGGVSAIARCRQTLQIDKQSLPIQWNDDDRFCLEGQRLLVSGTYTLDANGVPQFDWSAPALYGATNAAYRTEIDSYAAIAAVGGTSGHPDYFIVTRKDGSTSYYGQTFNSKQIADNGYTLTWGINTFKDSIDNPIKFLYQKDMGGDNYALKRVSYAFGANKTGSSGRSYIEFNYDANVRRDPINGFIAGQEFNNTLRLERIDSYNAVTSTTSQLMRSYHLNYQVLPSNPRPQDALVSRMESIEECLDIDGLQCMPKTEFEWAAQLPLEDAPKTPLFSRELAGPNQGISAYATFDFNGDGFKDIAWMLVYPDGSQGAQDQRFAYAAGSTNGGLVDQPFDNGEMSVHTSDNPINNGDYDMYAVDYNADGRDDIILYRELTSTWQLYLSTPQIDGTWRLKLRDDINLPFVNWDNIIFGDLNGDGLVDAVQYQSLLNRPNLEGAINGIYINVYKLERDITESTTSSTPFKYALANSNDLTPIYSGVFGTLQSLTIVDINNDGASELLTSIYHHQSCSIEYYYSEEILDCNAFGSRVKVFEVDLEGENDSLSEIDTGINDYTLIGHNSIGDINGDGAIDFVYKAAHFGWRIALNRGNSTFAVTDLNADVNITYKNFSLLDLNADGYADLVWQNESANNRYISYWDPQVQNFSSILSSFPMDDNWSFNYLNADGDSGPEFLEVYQAPGAWGVVNLWDIDTLPDGHANIKTITNGLGMLTNIEYSSLSDTDHYQRVDGINATQTTKQVCYPQLLGIVECFDIPVSLANSDAFYQQINSPFTSVAGDALRPEMAAPILEMFGPSTLVTRISSSAPAANDVNHSQVDNNAESAVSYIYHQAKIQAAGRGYLGFKKIQSIDEQTGVITTTEYRQDFPFVGLPIKTEVRTSNNELLSESSNEWSLKSFSRGDFDSGTWLTAAAENGCKDLGALQVLLTRSVETSYATESTFDQPLLVNTTALQTVVTVNEYDDVHGNVYKQTIENRSGGEAGTLIKEIVSSNSYIPEADWGAGWTTDKARRFGRLSDVTVTHKRFDNDVPFQDRRSRFTYYAMNPTTGGLLKDEIIEPDDLNLELKTTHEYDDYGNESRATQTAANANNGYTTNLSSLPFESAANNRYSRWEYDHFGRYVERTYNSKEQLVEEVISRNQYGMPTQVSNIDGVVTEMDYTPTGKPYLMYSPSGAWQQTAYGNCQYDTCVSGAKHSVTTIQAGGSKSTEYFDVLGRSIQTQQVGFNGLLNITQTEYDAIGRIKRQSEPYVDVNERYWTQTSYDILGRPVQVLLPHRVSPVLQTAVYDGLTTTTTIAASDMPTQTSSQTVNVLGELVEIIDSHGGKIASEYNAQGNLIKTTTSVNNNNDGVANGVPGSIEILFIYDKLGRKTGTVDLDRGSVQYRYNGFGELIRQVDAESNFTLLFYDTLGRQVTRWRMQDKTQTIDDFSVAVVEDASEWVFDSAHVGPGKLDYVKHGVFTDWLSGPTSGYIESYFYDHLGRNTSTLTQTGTAANDAVFTRSTTFDQYGRVFQKFDASGSEQGVMYEYNNAGYLQRVKEAVAVNGSYQLYFHIVDMTPRNQVSRISWGNGNVSSRSFDFARGIPEALTTVSGMYFVQDLELEFDSVGNLIERVNRGLGAGANATSMAKNFTEKFEYDDLNRLTRTLLDNVATQTLTYDSFGNIKTKSDVGNYTYGENSAGPHAVTSTSDGLSYSYNLNGSMVSDTDGRSLVYSTFDKPVEIVKGNHQVNFEYGPGNSRYKRIDTNTLTNVIEKTTVYMGGVERITHSNGTVEFKRYIEGMVLVTNTTSSGGSSSLIQYLIKDHLGSTELVLNHSPTSNKVAEDMSFDPWGYRRQANDLAAMSITDLLNFDSSTTTRGFSGHEMLDSVGLVHMNGRIYDPRLGRFMQADVIIDGVGNTQGYNRYSYVSNNPLSYIDPTGHFKLRRWAGPIAAVVGVIVCGPPCAQPGLAAFSVGAAAGAIGAAANGGGIFQGALTGGVSAVAFAAVAEYALANWGGTIRTVVTPVRMGKNMYLTASGAAKLIALQATVGGVMSVMQGGKFGHGFVSAGITKLATPVILSFDNVVVESIASGVVGGTASKLTGGKFANGAQTGTFLYAFNSLSSKLKKFVGPQLSKKRTEALRRLGVRKAWAEEIRLVRETGEGSRAWDADQLALLKEGKRVPGFEGHHINDVSNHPGMAANPSNIQFFTRSDHFAEHSNNWRNSTTGALIDRATTFGVSGAFVVIDVLSIFDPTAHAEAIYGGNPFFSDDSSCPVGLVCI